MGNTFKVPSRARRELTIRLNSSERNLLEDAAAKEVKHLTVFIREKALIAARRALSDNGRRMPEVAAP